MLSKWFQGLTCLLLLVLATASVAEERLKPFVLGSQSTGDLSAAVAATKQKLSDAGFEVVGSYAPYADAEVIVVTNDQLKAAAGKSEFGGFGAAQRVSVTRVGEQVQVAYANPRYTAAAYRMADDLSAVANQLAGALGAEQVFGSEDGLTVDKLKRYHYMFAMPYFDSVDELNEFDSHQAAVAQIEKGLADGVAGASKVYRIDVPGSEAVLFGVALAQGDGADTTVMSATDKGELKHTAHLPYELLVDGKKAIALAGKFRIAVNFPDLSMGTFMKISGAPSAIRNALREVAGR